MLTRAALAKIHMAKKEVGMDEDVYRTMLHDRYGAASSKELKAEDVDDLLVLFSTLGWTPKPKGRPRPSVDRKSMIGKIIKLTYLLEKVRDEGSVLSYADGIAKNMFFRDQPKVSVSVEHLTEVRLHKVVAALMVQCRRKGVSTVE